jgi:hypothetical protein
MIRAPFLSSILAPLVAGTLVSVFITGDFRLPGFLLVLVMGIGLHAATNVYNDIYDTLQGSDKINVLRNEFSGGSGILVEHPEFMDRMRWTARGGLILAGPRDIWVDGRGQALSLAAALGTVYRPLLFKQVLHRSAGQTGVPRGR